MIHIKNYEAPPLNLHNLSRGISEKDYSEALSLCEKELAYKVCYVELPVKIFDGICDFSLFSLTSHDLAKNLHGPFHIAYLVSKLLFAK